MHLDIFHYTLSVNLNGLENNYVKLVITFINLTCIIELKYMSVGIILRFDYGVRLIVPRLANERDAKSLS